MKLSSGDFHVFWNNQWWNLCERIFEAKSGDYADQAKLEPYCTKLGYTKLDKNKIFVSGRKAAKAKMIGGERCELTSTGSNR